MESAAATTTSTKKQPAQASKKKNENQFAVSKTQQFSSWYLKILESADVLDNRYPLKGSFVWKPHGFYMLKQVTALVEEALEKQKYEQTQFPCLIPQSLLRKHNEYSLGFENESFWITKIGMNDLAEPIALRPTSESIIYSTFAGWVQTYRDLPIKVFQTGNVYRHETHGSHPLLRSREMQWTEAHSCHENKQQAEAELDATWKNMLTLFQEQLGLKRGIKLRRMKWDTFPSAEYTDCYDYVLPNGRIIQVAASHYLGTNYSTTFKIRYNTRESSNSSTVFEHGHLACFGVSMRLLAVTIAEHGDDKGLVLPPRLCKTKVVIVPVLAKEKNTQELYSYCNYWVKLLEDQGISVILDDSDKRPGDKYYYWECRGVPIRLEIGAKEQANQSVCIVRRDTGKKELVKAEEAIPRIRQLFDLAQSETIVKNETAEQTINSLVQTCANLEQVKEVLATSGGFARIPIFWDPQAEVAESAQIEKQIFEETNGGEIRGYKPSEQVPEGTKCILTGKDAVAFVYIAKM